MIEYELPNVSGNTINGLEAREIQRPRHVYHAYPDDLEWGDLYTASKDLYSRTEGYDTSNIERRLMHCYWLYQYRTGSVAGQQHPFESPRQASEAIKQKARELGAEMVGMTRLRSEWVFEGRTAPGEYFISLGLHMEMDWLAQAPEPAAAEEVIRVYSVVAQIATDLARHIRSLGYPALAHQGPSSGDVLQIPGAIESGLAQLGKHGSLISKEFGSSFRLSAVTTDLPLEIDQPEEIGVDDFCQSCHVCTDKCPPDAIFPEKQMVRGRRKWYVDFDKCAPYFTETEGCAICLAVCPWSKPGIAPKLVAKMMKQRSLDRSGPARLAAKKRHEAKVET